MLVLKNISFIISDSKYQFYPSSWTKRKISIKRWCKVEKFRIIRIQEKLN